MKREIVALSTRAKLKKRTVENYIMLPNHKISDIIEATSENQLKFETKALFCPHLSTENPPDLIEDLNEIILTILDGKPMEFVNSIINSFENFCLALVKFDSLSDSISTVHYKTKGTISS